MVRDKRTLLKLSQLLSDETCGCQDIWLNIKPELYKMESLSSAETVGIKATDDCA